MPDQGGRLTKDDKGILNKWIAEHPPDGMRCPVCQGTNWLILNQLLSPIPINENGTQMMMRPASHTRVTMTCRTCGVITSLNARTVGIV